ncbi:MAG: UDP-N-acetylglucosamine 4,6-dehydratase (inverting) [Syntrophorhabdus sp. PtaU1.Bin153]|nr:MAG: UDP-N-acetylglucosamine 4,6-dehydratase (inverting) [Syntrophorhabdus sp. PtaU1.Bin153]
MTRFWITLEQGAELVAQTVKDSVGGEVFVPKIPSMRILDLIKAISTEAEYEVVGIRPGEKLHESLVSEDDGRNTIDLTGVYVILPPFANGGNKYYRYSKYPRMSDGFSYRSDNNVKWLTVEDIRQHIQDCDCE